MGQGPSQWQRLLHKHSAATGSAALLTLSAASGSALSTFLICLVHVTTALSRMRILSMLPAVAAGSCCARSAAGSGSVVWPLDSPMLMLTAGGQGGGAEGGGAVIKGAGCGAVCQPRAEQALS